MKNRLKTVKEIQAQRTKIVKYCYNKNLSLFNRANMAYKNIASKVNKQRGCNSNFLLNDYDNKMYQGVKFITN